MSARWKSARPTIVVVTRHPTLEFVYWVAASGGGAPEGRKDVRGAEAAAALALDRAIAYGGSGYFVAGPAEVLKHIPEALRIKS